MSYGMKFVNGDGVRVIGAEEDNLRFIGKVTTYTTAVYAGMYYLTFTVTSTEFPIVYLYIPYDDVGTCSDTAYTDMTTCLIAGEGWSWTNVDERNLATVHNIYNTSGTTWKVTVICGHGGYPKKACIYVFNTVGSTASTDTYGFRTYKADGTTLAFDSGFTPLMSRWGAEFTTMPSGSFAVQQKTFTTGDWATRSVSKPAFNCSINNISYNRFNCLFGYHYMLYYRHFVAVTANGVAIWTLSPSGRYQPSIDVSLNNGDCTTNPFAGTSSAWYSHTKTLPFIDGADYD